MPEYIDSCGLRPMPNSIEVQYSNVSRNHSPGDIKVTGVKIPFDCAQCPARTTLRVPFSGQYDSYEDARSDLRGMIANRRQHFKTAVEEEKASACLEPSRLRRSTY